MSVVDASIVVRLLQNRREDAGLRAWFEQHRHIHAPALIDAEVASATRGLLMTSKAAITITAARASQMLDDFADLPLHRYPMQPYQRRVLALLDNFTAYDAVLHSPCRVTRHAAAHRRSKVRQGTRPHGRHRNLAVEP